MGDGFKLASYVSNMTATVKRDNYFSFWNKYSRNADINTMMLSSNADKYEPYDRADIMASLPDFTDMDVVDVGAGIGRFTSMFAERARHVLSSDFIAEFVAKNRERNAHHANVSFHVSDALGLRLGAECADLVFTNWLLMYLSAAEVAQFLGAAMRWLRPGGFAHVRESCTESSAAQQGATSSLHQGARNPSHYRYASVYLRLFQEFRWADEAGARWRFDVRWAKSVPAYIEFVRNWRQVHWLLVKVPAEQHGGITSPRTLASSLAQWKVAQDHIDHLLQAGAPAWTDAALTDHLPRLALQSESLLLTYSARVVSANVFVNAHDIARAADVNIWALEANPYSYRNMLNRCMEAKDRRVQVGWNARLESAIQQLQQQEQRFSAFVATELFMANDSETLELLAANLPANIKVLDVIDVSAYCNVQKQAFDSPNQPCWLLVHARLA